MIIDSHSPLISYFMIDIAMLKFGV